MLSTIISFMYKHVVLRFARALSGFFINRSARKMGRKILDLFFGTTYDWECTNCDKDFSYDYLYEGYWLKRKTCPVCNGNSTLRKKYTEEEFQEATSSLGNPVKIYKVAKA